MSLGEMSQPSGPAEPFDAYLYLLTDPPFSRLCRCMHTSSNEVHERRYKVRLRINPQDRNEHLSANFRLAYLLRQIRRRE